MGEAHLVQAARVTVEEHTHALVEELAGSLLSELVLLAIDGSTEEWDSDVGTVACSDRRRGIGRAKEIYVAEEPVGRGRALLALVAAVCRSRKSERVTRSGTGRWRDPDSRDRSERLPDGQSRVLQSSTE